MARWRSISNSPAGARGRLHKFGDLRAIARYFTIRPDFGERRRAALRNTRDTRSYARIVLIRISQSPAGKPAPRAGPIHAPRRESARLENSRFGDTRMRPSHKRVTGTSHERVTSKRKCQRGISVSRTGRPFPSPPPHLAGSALITTLLMLLARSADYLNCRVTSSYRAAFGAIKEANGSVKRARGSARGVNPSREFYSRCRERSAGEINR